MPELDDEERARCEAANRLRDAAPALLEALHTMTDLVATLVPSVDEQDAKARFQLPYDRARAALAQATGTGASEPAPAEPRVLVEIYGGVGNVIADRGVNVRFVDYDSDDSEPSVDTHQGEPIDAWRGLPIAVT